MSADRYYTSEEPPRKLTIRGRSAIDPDILVAENPDGGQCLWIIENQDRKASEFFVCNQPYKAVRLPPLPTPPKATP